MLNAEFGWRIDERHTAFNPQSELRIQHSASAGGERLRVQVLEGVDLEGVRAFARGDGLDDGLRAGHGRDAGDVELERGAADGALVEVRGAPQGRVDDER